VGLAGILPDGSIDQTLRHFAGPGITFESMKIARACAVNCFFACMLFNAAASGLAAEAERSVTPAAEKRPENNPNMETKKIKLAIHGGAGTIDRANMTPEKEREYRAGLERALAAGYDILKRGGSSLDATEAAVRVLEDDPHFNAGKGSVFTSAGTNEMDAAIMDGKTLAAGAVAALKHVKNPIRLARLVMEKSGHVMMDGEGAEAFAKGNGIELVDARYFFTQERWDALQKMKAAEKHRTGRAGKAFVITDQDRHGTVGAVALDKDGNLAAATSTGGTTNKRPGRVGDTPVIGAGTYADNVTCAVSATGDGEYFIRATAARDVSALMECRSMSLRDAAQSALDKVAKLGGTGGLIAIDRQGNVALPFNTSGMYRGYVDPDGKFVVEIYK
jgi:beta-aspartyl-peptidase (threonine type)